MNKVIHIRNTLNYKKKLANQLKLLLKNDQPEIVDAIGDMVVVLTNLAHLQGYDIEYCIDEAYKVIAENR